MGKPNTVTLSEMPDGEVSGKIHTHPYDQGELYNRLHNKNKYIVNGLVDIPSALLIPPIGLVVIASTITESWEKDPEAKYEKSTDFTFIARRK